MVADEAALAEAASKLRPIRPRSFAATGTPSAAAKGAPRSHERPQGPANSRLLGPRLVGTRDLRVAGRGLQMTVH